MTPDKLQTMRNILIVDDDQIDRMAIKRYLSTLPSITIYEAESGTQALGYLKDYKFDCIFLDYLLPDMDGLQFLDNIYDAETDLAPAPIIMLTGHGSEPIMLEALRYGAQDYLVKDSISGASINIALVKAKEIFELKQSRKIAEEQLNQAHKLEAVGQLTSGIAHDFNNLLTVVLGNTRLLRRKIEHGNELLSPDDLLSKITAIDAAANKGAELVRRLMVFTRQRAPVQEVIDANKYIQETISLLQRTLGSTIEVKMIPDPNLWGIMVDPSQFENVLINMAVNARDAMNKQGRLTIETSNTELDEIDVLQYHDIKPGQYIQISISDTGAGMEKEVLKKIFEPFFTTKEVGEGTGLGLSMVYGFVKQSGGHIHVYSEKDHGSVFRIFLPRYNEVANVHPLNIRLPAGSETILIVDDDSDVADAARIILESLGYQTLVANNSRTALEILKLEGKKIDLIFADIIMPGDSTGIELARAAREQYPDMKILYTSGYTENAVPYSIADRDEIISKPYRKETLACRVRKILDGENMDGNIENSCH